PLPQQNGVLGDHDAHGSSTAIRVPAPDGDSSASVPPEAATRSAIPASPRPATAVAPPTPSSATLGRRTPSKRFAVTTTPHGDACLTALVTASHATKYATASISGGARSPDASTSTGTVAPRARSSNAADSPSSSRGGRTPAAIVRRSAIVAVISSTAE